MIRGATIAALIVLGATTAQAACGPSITISGGVTNTNDGGYDRTIGSSAGTSSNDTSMNNNSNSYRSDRGFRDSNNFRISLKIPLGKDYCSEKKEQDFYLQRAKVAQQQQKNQEQKIKFCAENKTLPEAALYCQEFIVDTTR